jgi:hypothetical protein
MSSCLSVPGNRCPCGVEESRAATRPDAAGTVDAAPETGGADAHAAATTAHNALLEMLRLTRGTAPSSLARGLRDQRDDSFRQLAAPLAGYGAEGDDLLAVESQTLSDGFHSLSCPRG